MLKKVKITCQYQTHNKICKASASTRRKSNPGWKNGIKIYSWLSFTSCVLESHWEHSIHEYWTGAPQGNTHISHGDYTLKSLILVDSIFFILQKRKQSSKALSDLPEATATNRCQSGDFQPTPSQIFLPSTALPLTLNPPVILAEEIEARRQATPCDKYLSWWIQMYHH